MSKHYFLQIIFRFLLNASLTEHWFSHRAIQTIQNQVAHQNRCAHIQVRYRLNNPADVFYNVTGDTLGIPNAGNNTVSFVGFTNTAMNDVSLKNEIAFSPNPALRHEKISFKIKTPSPVKIDLIDLNGKQIGEVFNSNGKLTSGSFLVLPSDKLESGIYFLKTNTLQKTYLEKIVIL